MVACEGRRWAAAEQREGAALNPPRPAAAAEAGARAAVSWAAAAEARDAAGVG